MHGRLDLYEKIKEYIKPEDNVFFLGDAIDRGPHGVEIMLDILKQSNWIYLKGNHEDMMYAGLAKECGLEVGTFTHTMFSLHIYKKDIKGVF